MSEMNEFTPELIELIDDKGNKRNFEILDCAEIDGEQYYAIIPAIEDENFLNADCDIIIVKSVFEGDEEVLATVDDEAEHEKVWYYFFSRMDIDDFDDDDIFDDVAYEVE